MAQTTKRALAMSLKKTDLDLPIAVMEKVMTLMPFISKTVIGELLVRYNMI